MFAPNGDFHLAPPGGWQELAELWRHTALRRLRASGALADWQIAKIKNRGLRPRGQLIARCDASESRLGRAPILHSAD